MRNQHSFRITKELRPTDMKVSVSKVLNKVDEEGKSFYPNYERPITVALQSADGKVFETTKATADGAGILNFEIRGLPDDSSLDGVEAFRKHWNPGTICIVTMASQDLIGLGSDNERTGENTFHEDTKFKKDVEVEGELKVDKPIEAQGGVKIPEYISVEDATTAITAPYPGMQIVIQGEIYKRNNMYERWEVLAQGEPVPTASKIIPGSVMLANEDDMAEGRDERDGKPVVVQPSGLSVSALTEKIFPLGEDVEKNDVLFLEDMIDHSEIDGRINVGKEIENQKIGLVGIGKGATSDKITLDLKKEGSPSTDLEIRIETDDDGKPSGILIDENAYASLSPASVPTTATKTEITLNGEIEIGDGVVCWVVAKQEHDTVNSSNYYSIGKKDTITFIRESVFYDGSDWTITVKEYFEGKVETKTGGVGGSSRVVDGEFTLTPNNDVLLKRIVGPRETNHNKNYAHKITRLDLTIDGVTKTVREGVGGMNEVELNVFVPGGTTCIFTPYGATSGTYLSTSQNLSSDYFTKTGWFWQWFGHIIYFDELSDPGGNFGYLDSELFYDLLKYKSRVIKDTDYISIASSSGDTGKIIPSWYLGIISGFEDIKIGSNYYCSLEEGRIGESGKHLLGKGFSKDSILMLRQKQEVGKMLLQTNSVNCTTTQQSIAIPEGTKRITFCADSLLRTTTTVYKGETGYTQYSTSNNQFIEGFRDGGLFKYKVLNGSIYATIKFYSE